MRPGNRGEGAHGPFVIHANFTESGGCGRSSFSFSCPGAAASCSGGSWRRACVREAPILARAGSSSQVVPPRAGGKWARSRGCNEWGQRNGGTLQVQWRERRSLSSQRRGNGQRRRGLRRTIWTRCPRSRTTTRTSRRREKPDRSPRGGGTTRRSSRHYNSITAEGPDEVRRSTVGGHLQLRHRRTPW